MRKGYHLRIAGDSLNVALSLQSSELLTPGPFASLRVKALRLSQPQEFGLGNFSWEEISGTLF